MIARIFLIVLVMVSQIYGAEDIRYLTPPKLEAENVLQKILCHRPRREGQPRIEREGNIIHDYGHGSGGWCMAWGAAEEAISLLNKDDDTSNIGIVGGGISGLAAAYKLVKLGYTPTIIARDFDNLTSHNAGGLFAHQSSNPDKIIRDRVNRWIIESLKVYKKIAEGKHPDFKSGVRTLPAYFKDRKTSDLEECVKAGILQPAKDVVVDFKNGTRKNMVVYEDNVFIDTPNMMQKFQTFLKEHDVEFIQQDVEDLNKVPHSIVFNCTGLGAGKLVPNDAHYLMPVQGHLLLLKEQNPDELQYTLELELEDGITSKGFNASYLCYVFPKKLPDAKKGEIGVLGGTFIKNADKDTPHEEEFEHVRRRARRWFGMN